MIDRIRRFALLAAPIVAVATVTVSSAIESIGENCDECVNGKATPAGTAPDYDETCYETGNPPTLPSKKASCLACIQDACGNACSASHLGKCGLE